ncbi:hypothetical protein U1Q18_005540, partial [Sarracenia purpurea var. burkii]
GCCRDDEKFQYGIWLCASKDEMGAKIQRNTSKYFNVPNRELSISSSSAKNSDRTSGNHHEQPGLQRSEGLPVKPSSGSPELQLPLLAGKKFQCFSEDKSNSGMIWGIGEKSKEDQSSSEDQSSQIPEGSFQKASAQIRSGESENIDQDFSNGNLRTRFGDGQSGSSALKHRGCYGLDAHHGSERGKSKIPCFSADIPIPPTEDAQSMEIDQDSEESIEALPVGDLIPCKLQVQKPLTHATNSVVISSIKFPQSPVTILEDPNLGGVDLAERNPEREPLLIENRFPSFPISPVHQRSPSIVTNSVIISSTAYPQSSVTNCGNPGSGGVFVAERASSLVKDKDDFLLDNAKADPDKIPQKPSSVKHPEPISNHDVLRGLAPYHSSKPTDSCDPEANILIPSVSNHPIASLRACKKWVRRSRPSSNTFSNKPALTKRKLKNDNGTHRPDGTKKLKTLDATTTDGTEASQNVLSSFPQSAEAAPQPCRTL